jgi:hypothetical protein
MYPRCKSQRKYRAGVTFFFPVPSGDLALIDGRCLVKQWETIASQLVDTVLFEEL